jgi:hypothetical protein
MNSIMLPYFKDIPEMTELKQTPEMDTFYTPYQLFCISNRLQNRLLNRLNSELVVGFVSDYTYNKANISIRLTDGGDPVYISDEMRETLNSWLEDILGDYALWAILFTNRPIYSSSYGYLSSDWISTMLPFLNIPEEYQPFVRHNKLYVNLSKVEGFTDIYNSLLRKSQNELLYMYGNGYLHLPSEAERRLSQEWGMTAVNKENNLWRSTWFDERITTDVTKFLRERLSGNNMIYFKTSSNLAVRHLLAQYLTELGLQFMFSATDTIIKLSNIQHAHIIAALIEYSTAHASGKVLSLSVKNTAEANRMLELSQPFWPQEAQAVVYPTLNFSSPYVFSTHIRPEVGLFPVANLIREGTEKVETGLLEAA